MKYERLETTTAFPLRRDSALLPSSLVHSGSRRKSLGGSRHHLPPSPANPSATAHQGTQKPPPLTWQLPTQPGGLLPGPTSCSLGNGAGVRRGSCGRLGGSGPTRIPHQLHRPCCFAATQTVGGFSCSPPSGLSSSLALNKDNVYPTQTHVRGQLYLRCFQNTTGRMSAHSALLARTLAKVTRAADGQALITCQEHTVIHSTDQNCSRFTEVKDEAKEGRFKS